MSERAIYLKKSFLACMTKKQEIQFTLLDTYNREMYSGQKVVHGVSFFPALVKPECLLTQILTLRVQASLEPVQRNQMH